MKKIFTFFAAAMVSMSMLAAVVVPEGTLNPANVPSDGWAGKATPAYVENGDWVCFLPYEVYQSTQTWAAKDASGSTSGSWDATDPFPASTAWSGDVKSATVRDGQKGPYYYRVTNCTSAAILAKSGSNGKRTVYLEAYELTAGVAADTAFVADSTEENTIGVVDITGLDKTKEYVIVVRQLGTGTKGSSDGNSNFYALAFETVMSTDPVLNVSAASVDLNATAAETTVSEVVTFSGKNLTAGTYNLTVPTVAGLSADPTSVTVGEDGKLSADVTITYTSAVDVAAANAVVSLTIGALTQNVTVNYSAVMAKQYLNASLNIEQLVLDNGKSYDIASAFTAANIVYNNIDQLDSLNDEKANRNYPYLGLKLKKADASLACWVKAGDKVTVKFGNVGADFKVIAGGMEQTLTSADYANTSVDSTKVLEFTATVDTYVEIVCASTKTLVVKQIMLNEAIKSVTLPAQTLFQVTCAEAENGTVTLSDGKSKGTFSEGDKVVLIVTPAEGYKTISLTWNGTALYEATPGAELSFTMPAENVEVVAVFGTDFPTGIDNSKVDTKAVKVIRNGQLLIEKNGMFYNAQGTIVK